MPSIETNRDNRHLPETPLHQAVTSGGILRRAAREGVALTLLTLAAQALVLGVAFRMTHQSWESGRWEWIVAASIVIVAICAFLVRARMIHAIREVEAIATRADQAESRLREIATHMREVFYVVDGDLSRILYVNPAIERLSGAPMADLQGGLTRWLEFIHPEDRERFVENAARSRLEARQDTYRLLRRDGKLRWARFSSLPIESPPGCVARVAGIVEDITEEVAAREAQSRITASFRTLIEQSPDPVFAIRQDFSVSYANSAAERVLGYDRGGLLGRNIADLSFPEDVPERLERIEAARAGNRVPRVEVRLRRADGSATPLEVTQFAVELEGEPVVVAIARDLTETAQMRAQLALSDRLASVGTLAAGVAHEINNPLTWILSNLHEVSTGLHELSELAAHLPKEVTARVGEDCVGTLAELTAAADEAADGAERVRDIVRSLKSFSRTEDDRRSPVSINDAVRAASNMARNEMKYRARFVADLQEVPLVVANEGRLAQVVLNLLVNSAHAIPEGDVAANEIRVSTRHEGSWIVMRVRDTGCGMPSHVLNRIFEPFFTTKPAGVGSGLGLPICRSIVAAAGGTIEATSEPGKGTEFVVKLPVSPEAADTPAPGADHVPVPRKRVLVVEDEAAIARTIRRLLPELDLTFSPSGRDARERLQRESFDLVLADLMMPEGTGHELYEWSRSTCPSQRFVFMTGGAFTPDAQALAEQHTVIEKPFETAVLRRVITEALA